MADDQSPDYIDVAFEFKLTELDLEIIATMQRAGGFPTMEEVFEHAVIHYARHLQIGNVPSEFMDFRRRLDRLGRFRKGK